MSGPAVAAGTQQDAKITLHWLEKSRSQRILWLFEELKLDYNLSVHKRGSDGLAGADLKAIHPLGKSPAITVEPKEGPKRVIAESAAIVEYITDYFGQDLIPKRWQEGKENKLGGETEEWIRYRFFMHYAEGSLMTLMMIALIVSRIKDAPVPFFIKPVTRRIAGGIEDNFLIRNFETHYKFLEDQLSTSGGDFLCGSKLTGADILLQFPLEAATGRAGLTKDKYPKTVAYVNRLMDRPAYKAATERIQKDFGKYESINDF